MSRIVLTFYILFLERICTENSNLKLYHPVPVLSVILGCDAQCKIIDYHSVMLYLLQDDQSCFINFLISYRLI